MPFIETMYNKHGEIIDSCPFIFKVSTDGLRENWCAGHLTIRPLDPDVVITREYYDASTNEPAGFDRVTDYGGNFCYNEEDDEIMLYVFNGFDVAIFNMCSLLGIGRLALADEVPYNENGFAPVHDKVRAIYFTLEEFKMLDGCVAWFKFTKHFILFKGLVIGANYVHEDVHDGDVVPDFRSDVLQRGERLFLLD